MGHKDDNKHHQGTMLFRLFHGRSEDSGGRIVLENEFLKSLMDAIWMSVDYYLPKASTSHTRMSSTSESLFLLIVHCSFLRPLSPELEINCIPMS
jgi:hypothetical protein